MYNINMDGIERGDAVNLHGRAGVVIGFYDPPLGKPTKARIRFHDGVVKGYTAKEIRQMRGGNKKQQRSRKTNKVGGARRKKRSSLKKSLSNSLSSMSNFLSPKKGKKSKRGKKGKTVKRSKGKKKKKPLNPYMKALKKARDSDAPSFTYNGKTYYQKTTKTGMKIYGAK